MSVATVLNSLFGGNTRRDEANGVEVESTLLEAGDFKLDSKTHSVLVREQRLELAPDEFDLLRYLLTHHRKLVTPRTMLSTPRPEASVVHRANFLATLLSLRKKFAAVPNGADYLQVEPWLLYSFHTSR